VHVGAFNLSLVLRKMLGAGTPREWKNRAARLILRLFLWLAFAHQPDNAVESGTPAVAAIPEAIRSRQPLRWPCRNSALCTTGC